MLSKYVEFIFSKQLNLALFLSSVIRSKIKYFILKKNSLDIYIINSDTKFVATFLKLNSYTQFDSLIDISVVDFPQKKKRFKIIYNFLSIFFCNRLNLISFISENSFQNSIRYLFFSANWLEREVWDMFGIYFLNHNDLRRLLTDYGFQGFPLRKDFPLTGYIELRHDDSKGDIVYEPVELTQELRFFNFSTGWEKDQ